MWLEERVLLTGTNPVPIPLQPPSGPLATSSGVVSGNLTQGTADFYQVVAGADSRLLAQTNGASSALELRLSLFDSQGHLLVASDGQSTGRLNPLIDQHIAAGAAILEVQSINGDGGYSLTASLTPASDPGQTLPLPQGFQSPTGQAYAPLSVGDFNNDGNPDIVAADGVHLGTGDGTFQTPSPTGALVDPSQETPSAIVAGHFYGDSNLDVAVAIANTDSVWIFQGNGDGTFQQPLKVGLSVAGVADALVARDFGNGRTDLAVAVSPPGDSSGDVVILMNQGGGIYTQSVVPVGINPSSIAAGNFTGTGRIDLAVADFGTGISPGGADVTVLRNDGTGNFHALTPIMLPAGSAPTAIVAGNFGTGHLNLAVADSSFGAVYLLDGDGTDNFQLASTISVAATPRAIVAGDFGNGQTDLAVASQNESIVQVLLGNGNGTFQPAIATTVGNTPLALAAGDFNRDGHLDMAPGNWGSNDISVLLGKGDGTFQVPAAILVGNDPVAMATGDFTGEGPVSRLNGNLGVAIVNQDLDSVTILPGNGDGTFQQEVTVPLPAHAAPTGIVAADFNGDGRTDLAVVDNGINEISIIMGNGDGTFEPPLSIPVPGGPFAITAGDFGNGRVDLAVADSVLPDGRGGVTILMNNGNGTWDSHTIEYGNPTMPPFPSAIVAGNFTGDGKTDLAVADAGSDDVTVFPANGIGTFGPPQVTALGGSSTYLSLVAGHFRNNTITDLAVATTDFVNGDSVDLLFNKGNGYFTPQTPIPLAFGTFPIAITAGDFYGHTNGLLDLATADTNGFGGDDYSVFQNLGNGNFVYRNSYPLSNTGVGASVALVAGQFTSDGRTDLAISRFSPGSVQVVLSNNDGTFSPPSSIDLVRSQTPVVGDLNGDGIADVSVVDAAGNILYRAGQPGGSFAPPVTVNPGDPSRDIAFVETSQGPLLASVDANGDFVSLFSLGPSGFVLDGKLATGSLPAQILAADLDRTGFTDLIVRNAGDGTLSVFYGESSGGFSAPVVLTVGLGASDIAVADLHQAARFDIVYSDRLAGEVGVIQNRGGGNFAPPVLYQAGLGPYGVSGTAEPSPESSLEGTLSVAPGAYTSDGLTSLVALDPGSNTFSLLSDLGDGRLANAAIFPAPGNLLAVRAVNFANSTNGLAILTSEGLFIERSDGHGGFLPPTEINVGFEPNGLTVANLTGSGSSDLLVSNPLGDVEVLYENSDGTFQPAQSLDQQVALGVYAPGGSTPAAFIFANQRTDQLIVQTVGGGTTVLGDASTGLITPGAVKLADLNNNGILDLIVANSGSNNVLVFPGLGNGTFGPALNGGQGFFTGTNPVGITVADLTGNGRLDLIVADKGSNNVTILLNEPDGNGGFTFVQGPRLDVGVGPVTTAVADVTGSGVQDLLVTNSGSNSVWLLPGLGNGFFNDQNPMIIPVGPDPTGLYVANFTSGPGLEVATLDSGSNQITLISGLASGSPQIESISSGGIDPTAGFMVPASGSGLASLVVSNNADGNIVLFEGGANGLTLMSTLSPSALPNPSAMALASITGSNLEFYATNEGENSAVLLGFQLEETGALTSESSESSSASTGTAQLVSLNQTSLALLGTLLTVTLNLQNENQESVEGVPAALAAPPGSSSGNSLLGQSRYKEDFGETGDTLAPPGANLQASWARFVSGLDEAIEKIQSEADERLRQEQQPAKSDESGATRSDEQIDGRQQVSAALPDHAAREARRRLEAERDRVQAIDVAIAAWRQDELRALRALAAIIPGPSPMNALAPIGELFQRQDRAKLVPARRDLQTGSLDSPLSKTAALLAISATAALTGRIMLRRSSFPRRPRRYARTTGRAGC
jgi:hypothetical protein